MSFLRYRIDFAFKEPLKPQVINRLNALEQELRMLKAESVIINEGEINEEQTTKAGKHICHHDSGNKIPCEEEQEI